MFYTFVLLSIADGYWMRNKCSVIIFAICPAGHETIIIRSGIIQN